ncbi:hypothetical protein V7S43_017443 [Phytophthora oleae]|uniref:Uncharacterized protein n=1 Tax=Phytophthora oleae TaxID=2107226 RepID=A0ABD3EX59_9STRA
MDGAAANGHLHVVKWLHEHTSGGCTSNAMDGAAEHGHLSLLKWLKVNRTEGCNVTIEAMRKSLQNGHIAVASWLKRTFPQLKPQYVDLSFYDVSFPAVLFIQEHYCSLFTRHMLGEYRSDA